MPSQSNSLLSILGSAGKIAETTAVDTVVTEEGEEVVGGVVVIMEASGDIGIAVTAVVIGVNIMEARIAAIVTVVIGGTITTGEEGIGRVSVKEMIIDYYTNYTD